MHKDKIMKAESVLASIINPFGDKICWIYASQYLTEKEKEKPTAKNLVNRTLNVEILKNLADNKKVFRFYKKTTARIKEGIKHNEKMVEATAKNIEMNKKPYLKDKFKNDSVSTYSKEIEMLNNPPQLMKNIILSA